MVRRQLREHERRNFTPLFHPIRRPEDRCSMHPPGRGEAERVRAGSRASWRAGGLGGAARGVSDAHPRDARGCDARLSVARAPTDRAR